MKIWFFRNSISRFRTHLLTTNLYFILCHLSWIDGRRQCPNLQKRKNTNSCCLRAHTFVLRNARTDRFCRRRFRMSLKHSGRILAPRVSLRADKRSLILDTKLIYTVFSQQGRYPTFHRAIAYFYSRSRAPRSRRSQ
jgi:hypothetical protein